MAPKVSRTTGGGLRPHSRTSSATKVGANLQFTQNTKELAQAPAPKHAGGTDRSKKTAGYAHEAHQKAAPPFVRVNSSQRIHSKEQLALAQKRQHPYQHYHHQQQQNRTTSGTTNKAKAGFQIASPSEENADDDDEWVSSESGAATPNRDDSDSDTASESDTSGPPTSQTLIPAHAQQQARAPPPSHSNPPITNSRAEQQAPPPLPRVDTLRPNDFKLQLPPRLEVTTSTPSPRPQNPSQAPNQHTQSQQQPRHHHPQRGETDARIGKEPPTDGVQPRHSPRPKRHSRPPSMHSISSRDGQLLRPHPLIRGPSYGHASVNVPKTPLAPLTVIPNAALPEISTSPPSSVHDGMKQYMSTSPTSMKTSSVSPVSTDAPYSPYAQGRRTSISSARSVNTIPVHTTLIREPSGKAHDRARTLSTMSASSSSAALSSLVHLPTTTRPPSPQAVSFFPPVNPHANIEGIHPLLPNPYLCNHLTVLARRTPIRESFDRVSRAKFSK